MRWSSGRGSASTGSLSFPPPARGIIRACGSTSRRGARCVGTTSRDGVLNRRCRDAGTELLHAGSTTGAVADAGGADTVGADVGAVSYPQPQGCWNAAVAAGWSGFAEVGATVVSTRCARRAPPGAEEDPYAPPLVPRSGAYGHPYGGATGTIKGVHQNVHLTRANVRVRTRAARKMERSPYPYVQREIPDEPAFQASANAPAVKQGVEKTKGISSGGNTCPLDPRSARPLRCAPRTCWSA